MENSSSTLEALRRSAESMLDDLAQLEAELAELVQSRDRALELQRLRGDIRRAQAVLDGVPLPARHRNTGRQDRWTRGNMVVISGKLPNSEARDFVAACEKAGLSPYAVINSAARAFTADRKERSS